MEVLTSVAAKLFIIFEDIKCLEPIHDITSQGFAI